MILVPSSAQRLRQSAVPVASPWNNGLDTTMRRRLLHHANTVENMATTGSKCKWCWNWFDCPRRGDWEDTRHVADGCADYSRDPGSDDDTNRG